MMSRNVRVAWHKCTNMLSVLIYRLRVFLYKTTSFQKLAVLPSSADQWEDRTLLFTDSAGASLRLERAEEVKGLTRCKVLY
jgi:hypothetical protein